MRIQFDKQSKIYTGREMELLLIQLDLNGMGFGSIVVVHDQANVTGFAEIFGYEETSPTEKMQATDILSRLNIKDKRKLTGTDFVDCPHPFIHTISAREGFRYITKDSKKERWLIDEECKMVADLYRNPPEYYLDSHINSIVIDNRKFYYRIGNKDVLFQGRLYYSDCHHPREGDEIWTLVSHKEIVHRWWSDESMRIRKTIPTLEIEKYSHVRPTCLALCQKCQSIICHCSCVDLESRNRVHFFIYGYDTRPLGIHDGKYDYCDIVSTYPDGTRIIEKMKDASSERKPWEYKG